MFLRSANHLNDIPHELPCLGDLKYSGQLPVQEVFEVIQTFVPWQKNSKFISSRAKVAVQSHDLCFIVNFIVMSHNVMSFHVMPRHLVSRHVSSGHVMPRHVTLCYVMPRHVTSSYVVSRHFTSCYATSCHVMASHVVAGRSHDQPFIVNWLFPHAINSN